ncbi:MAG: carbon-nitrogen hydrolase family protein [Planctomycetes bacterium]|nr:carbon-nitrogen hydrolase family protein [Planctomycetota bacterium]
MNTNQNSPKFLLLSILLLALASSAFAKPQLKIATCQFPVSGDIKANAAYIKDFIVKADANSADIIHFPEAALSGYIPVDFPTFENYNWTLLRAETKKILDLAKKHNIHVILGSAHYISENEKPLNCLYIISNQGKIIDRYDKSFLSKRDVQYYTPGSHITTLELKGFKIAFLICKDSCFPEIYNILRHKGVKIIFQSFYNARHEQKTILDEIIPAQIRVRASDNLMWIVANNSTGQYSSWPTCIARPDGSLESLTRGQTGIMYRQFPDKKRTDDFRSWTHNNKKMKLCPNEVYHNSRPSNHPRATNTTATP